MRKTQQIKDASPRVDMVDVFSATPSSSWLGAEKSNLSLKQHFAIVMHVVEVEILQPRAGSRTSLCSGSRTFFQPAAAHTLLTPLSGRQFAPS